MIIGLGSAIDISWGLFIQALTMIHSALSLSLSVLYVFMHCINWVHIKRKLRGFSPLCVIYYYYSVWLSPICLSFSQAPLLQLPLGNLLIACLLKVRRRRRKGKTEEEFNIQQFELLSFLNWAEIQIVV